MLKQYLLIIILFLSFSACSSSALLHTTKTMPNWLLNPNINGKRGAVGVAGRMYDQSISSQRRLAITRALNELSLQKKVKVSLKMQKNEIVTNSSAYLNTTDYSTYTSDTVLTAHIQATWVDKSTRELYIWMILDK